MPVKRSEDDILFFLLFIYFCCLEFNQKSKIRQLRSYIFFSNFMFLIFPMATGTFHTKDQIFISTFRFSLNFAPLIILVSIIWSVGIEYLYQTYENWQYWLWVVSNPPLFSIAVPERMTDLIHFISLIRKDFIQTTGVHGPTGETCSFDLTRLPQLILH